MKIFNNKKLIIIIVIITICVITYFFKTKEESEIEFISNTTISNQNKIEEKETNEKIIIYITGEVINSGVYEMEENNRISDAIERAGGLTEKAYVKDLNLAQILEDGMKIYISNIDEMKNQIINEEKLETEKNNLNDNTSDNSKLLKTNKKININTATQSDLQKLPGIGESTALKIINYRKEKGKFSKVEDLKNVKGIGDSKFSKIKDLIMV